MLYCTASSLDDTPSLKPFLSNSFLILSSYLFILNIKLTSLIFTAFAPRFAVDVDVLKAERGEVAVHRVALVIPLLHLLQCKLGSAGGAGQRVHQVASRFVEGIHNHVAHSAAELLGVL